MAGPAVTAAGHDTRHVLRTGNRPVNDPYVTALELVERGWHPRDARLLRTARKLLQQALLDQPKAAPVHAVHGIVLDHLGRREEALAAFRRARAGSRTDGFLAAYELRLTGELRARSTFAARLAAIARECRIPLSAWRARLRAAGLPTDAYTLYLNAFPGSRTAVASFLVGERRRVRSRRRRR